MKIKSKIYNEFAHVFTGKRPIPDDWIHRKVKTHLVQRVSNFEPDGPQQKGLDGFPREAEKAKNATNAFKMRKKRICISIFLVLKFF